MYESYHAGGSVFRYSGEPGRKPTILRYVRKPGGAKMKVEQPATFDPVVIKLESAREVELFMDLVALVDEGRTVEVHLYDFATDLTNQLRMAGWAR